MSDKEKEMSFEFDFDETSFRQARLAVIGVGGGGGNALNHMYQADVDQVAFMIANTDIQALETSPVQMKIQLGGTTTKGLGAGANPNVGREAANESKEQIADMLRGIDMLFITVGLGGGTGTGAAPVIAQVARDMGILTVAVVTKPFSFEGRQRSMVAAQGLTQLAEIVNTLIVIPNERLLNIVPDLSFREGFKHADLVLVNAVRGISDLITQAGYVNVDFADVKAIMGNSGYALMGTGRASGEERAIVATQSAIESPLLDDISIEGAQGILVNVTGSSNVSLREVSDAASYIHEAAGGDAQIIFGLVEDESLGDEIKVTVIATGFDKPEVVEPVMTRTRARTIIPEPEHAKTQTRVDINNLEIPAAMRRQQQVDKHEAQHKSLTPVPVLSQPQKVQKAQSATPVPPPVPRNTYSSQAQQYGNSQSHGAGMSEVAAPSASPGAGDIVIPSFRRKLRD